MRQLYYTLQTLLRGRGGNLIKLLSLTLGLLAGVLLFSQIAYELNYENFYKDPDRVALLRVRWTMDGKQQDYNDGTFRPAAADLWEALPDLIESASLSSDFLPPEIASLYLEEKKLEDMEILFADTLFFRTIGLEVMKGDPQELAKPQTAFLSQTKARELFGDEDPLGKSLSLNKNMDIVVRGIYQDIPGNTVIQHNIVISLPTFDDRLGLRGTWEMNNVYHVFFRMKHDGDIEAMNRRVQQAVERYTDTKQNGEREFSVIALPDVHLAMPDTVRRLVILGVLGFSIFFVSIMNYVLAAVASFSRRAKAVGVHKCSGANGLHILGLFLWETALLVLASIMLGLLLMYIFREGIEELLHVRLIEVFTWYNLWVPLLTVMLLFFVAGFLPGRMFAGIPVTQVFRNYTDGKRSWKRGLLFVQFVGVAFILGMLLTTIWQYHELMTRSVGFRLERMAVGGSYTREAQNIEDAIRRQPYVESVARCSNMILSHYNTVMLYDVQGTFIASLHYQTVSKDFPQAVGLNLLEGTFPTRAGEALIGHKMVETMKWEGKALGQQLPIDAAWMGINEKPIVVGVVDDVRNMGFFEEQTCTAFIMSDGLTNMFNVRLKEPVDENLHQLNEFVKEAYPQYAMEFTTYTDIQRKNYVDVYRFRNTVWVTTLCIFFIVLMGLVGYVNDETQRRSKEIAIRKVNGAEASGILQLLSIGILKVAVGAVLIGIASAWYVSRIWLQQFPGSTLLSPLCFIGLGLLLLAFIVLVVVIKAWCIANENPVKSIKSE